MSVLLLLVAILGVFSVHASSEEEFEEVKNMQDVFSQLKDFAERESTEMSTAALNEEIEEAVSMSTRCLVSCRTAYTGRYLHHCRYSGGGAYKTFTCTPIREQKYTCTINKLPHLS